MVLAIFAIGIPFSAALVIRSSSAHTRLRDLAVQAIQDELGLRASLGQIQVELVPFRFVARDVAFEDPVYGRVADAARIRIRPSLRALMRGRVDLTSIELDGASVHLVVRDGQVRNVPRFREQEGGGGEVTLPFRELVIRRSTISVDAAPWASAEVRGVEATVRGEPGGVIDVEVRVAGGSIDHEGGHEVVRVLAGHAEVARDALRILHAQLDAGPLRVVVRNGLLPLPLPDPRATNSAYVGEIELDYDLAHLASVRLPVALPPLRGHLAVRARVLQDSTRGQRASGTVRLDDGGVLEFGLGDSVRLAFEATREEIRLTSGEVHVQGGGGASPSQATSA